MRVGVFRCSREVLDASAGVEMERALFVCMPR